MDTARLVVDKLYEVREKNIHFGYFLYKRFFERYSWRIVNAELVRTKDLGSSPIVPSDDAILYQAAVRDDRQKAVWVNKQIWEQLPAIHKAGLVFHEAIYATLVQTENTLDAAPTRNLVAYIFSPAFKFQSPEVFHEFISGRSLYWGDVLPGSSFLNNELAKLVDLENEMAAFYKELKEHADFFQDLQKKWETRARAEMKRLSLKETACMEGPTSSTYRHFYANSAFKTYGSDGVVVWIADWRNAKMVLEAKCERRTTALFGKNSSLNRSIRISLDQEEKSTWVRAKRLQEMKDKIGARKSLTGGDRRKGALLEWMAAIGNEVLILNL